MNSKSFTAGALARLPMLATMSFLAACSQTSGTLTVATEAAVASDVCRVWQSVTWSSRDTDRTQLEVRANNAARDAYCGVTK